MYHSTFSPLHWHERGLRQGRMALGGLEKEWINATV
jgi:hypothetical protein